MSSELQRPSPLVQPFYPALDGLRAIAFLLVFAVHYGVMGLRWQVLQWGWVGVDIFFVLSGFLITGILYDTLQRPNFFRGFYIRRSLRIFPLFYGFWLLLLLLTPFLHIRWNLYNATLPLYVENFFVPGARLGLHLDPSSIRIPSLTHRGLFYYVDASPFWSLCVEEQFYLFWPVVVWFVRDRVKLLGVCIGIIVTAPLLRILYNHLHPGLGLGSALYTATWARCDTLIVGAALALWLRGRTPSPATLRRLAIAALFPAPILLALLHLRTPWPVLTCFDPLVDTIGFTLVALAAAGLLILTVYPGTIVARCLQAPPLISLGRISYGLYFFHGMPAVYFFVKAPQLIQHHLGWVIPVAAFAYTYIAARLSFHYLESPFLRLKERLSPQRHHASDPPPDGSPLDAPLDMSVSVAPATQPSPEVA